MPKLRVLHPDIDIELRLSTAKLDLARGEADIAIRLGDPLQTSLVGRKVGDISFGLFAHTKYLKRFPPPKVPEDLNQHHFVELIGDKGKLPQELQLERMAPDARRVLRTDNMQVLLRVVGDGIAIGALPSYMLHTLPSSLIHILPRAFAPKAQLWILMRREVRDVARIRATTSFLMDVIKRFTE